MPTPEADELPFWFWSQDLFFAWLCRPLACLGAADAVPIGASPAVGQQNARVISDTGVLLFGCGDRI
ncbi:hypothetical protein [Aminobacter niigataensis]|uniref:hypothetical protein n=1 Tax=Aminobacter niigataensis TaxID=83265 RepID=UPI00298EEA31|nr:hypothetical protein [Aminobacter niigataensis]